MPDQPVNPTYLTFIQYYLLPLVQVAFWITVPLILYGALKQLRRLVDVYTDYGFDELDEDMDEDLDEDMDEEENGSASDLDTSK